MIFIHILLTVIFMKWLYIIVSATRELSKGYAEPSKPSTKEAPKQKEKPKSQSYKRQTYEDPKREQVYEEYTIPSPWDILNLSNGCPMPMVKKRYRLLAKQHHPDFAKSKGMNENIALEKMKQINAAYEEIIRSFR